MANEKRLVYLDDILADLHEVVEAAKADPDEIMRMAEACTGTIIKHLEKFPTVDAVEAHEYDAIVNKLECLLCHATGGQYSKAGYSLEDMERMVTDYIEECCEEAAEEAVVHGRWEQVQRWATKAKYRCSVCGREIMSATTVNIAKYPYCHCGAKMDGDGNG